MPEWFTGVSTEYVPTDLPILANRLLLAWLFGCLIAWLAKRNRPAGTQDTLAVTLVLMSILIAMATQIIGDNIARAFSLVGALSIVRFRTAVPATRDVAFVLAAVVVGMAVGAGQFWVASIGTMVVGLATSLSSRAQQESSKSEPGNVDKWKLTLQAGLSGNGEWEAELLRLSSELRLTSAETVRRGSAMQMCYRLVPNANVSPTEIVAALNALPAVESVSLKA